MGAILADAPGFLRLERAVERLIAEDDFEDQGTALRAIAGYERFFLLAASHRREPLTPSFTVDIIWQRHLLDTRAYARDCLRWAGVYLHRSGGAPEGAFERCRDALGVSGQAGWDCPGRAHVRYRFPAEVEREGVGRSLAEEDFARLISRVQLSLFQRRSAPAWVVESRRLVATSPDLALDEYKRFLNLLICGEGPLTPCKLVDEFWHQHILDSRNYHAFCHRVAGRFLHHDPRYGTARRAHERCFERTKATYRRRIGCAPPTLVWAHMGDSEGGGGDDSTPPTPLYVIDQAHHMRALLSVGKVDRRHFSSFHRVLPSLGLPKELWLELVRAVDSVPHVTWDDFKQTRGTKLLVLALASGALVGPFFYLFAIARFWVDARTSLLSPLLIISLVGSCALVTGIYLAGSWFGREHDLAELQRRMAHFSPLFAKYGIRIEESSVYAETFARYDTSPGRMKNDKFYADMTRCYLVIVDAYLHPDELRQRQRDEELAREAARAERRRRKAEAKRERAGRRRQRRTERDAYYLGRGVAPGPLAWYRVQSDWVQSILLGLAVALPILLMLITLYQFSRR